MNLNQLKKEIELLRERTRAHGVKCVCRYVEIYHGVMPDAATLALVRSNLACPAHARGSDNGFSFVEIAQTNATVESEMQIN